MKKLLFTLFAALAFVACDKENEPPKPIELTGGTEASQTIFADETEKSDGIKFKATAAWTATVSDVTSKANDKDAWLRLNAYSGGAGDVTLTISLDKNDTGKDRKTEIRITCDGTTIMIIVEQKATMKENEDLSSKIPDADFLKYLIDNFDINKNGKISTSEMAAITNMEIDSPYILKSLQGIEYCVDLINFNIRNSKIDMINLSEVRNLQFVNVSYSNVPKTTIIAPQINVLSVSGIANQTDEKIDISACKNLEELSISDMDINEVLFGDFENLKRLHLDRASVNTLDFKGANRLNQLIISNMQFNNMLDLAKITNLQNLDLNSVSINSLDLSECIGLKEVSFDNLRTETLTLNNSTLEVVGIHGLDCKVLDLGKLSLPLKEEESLETQITIGIVSKSLTIHSEGLEKISVSGTFTENIDTKGCLTLKTLKLIGSKYSISNPDIANRLTVGSNGILENIISHGSFWEVIDITGCKNVSLYHSKSGPMTSNFKLIGAEGLKKIIMHSDNVEKEFTSIDLSGNVGVENIEISGHKNLKSANISNCSKLENLLVSLDNIESLNVEGCTSLSHILCENGKLQSLDISSCSKLGSLFVSGNNLTSLDLLSCPNLRALKVSGNKLTTLDISMCDLGKNYPREPGLHYLKCAMSTLQTLYLKTSCELYGITDGRTEECILPVTSILYR